MTETPKHTPPRRRRYQFSLASLFWLIVVMAVLAVPLAWIVNSRRHSQRELRIAEPFLKTGLGQIKVGGPYDSIGLQPNPQGWQRDLARRVLGEKIYLLGPLSPDVHDLTALSELTNLQALYAQDTEVRDLTPLARHTNLKILFLYSTPVTDFSPLAELKNLQSLMLFETQISDLTPLAGLKNLKALNISSTKVSDLTPLAGLSNLQYLSLAKTPISDLTPLAGLANLKELNLSFTQVRDLTPLAGLMTLTQVQVTDLPVSKEQIAALQKALPKCDIRHDPFP
jgi:hypothetical protein